MFIRTLTAALVIPAIALSGAACAGAVYQGGPKSSIPMAAASQTFEIKKPYAQYVPGTPVSTNRHIYRGGPQTGEPHGR
jgi:hypothetical protein